jgi:hypothetical protein
VTNLGKWDRWYGLLSDEEEPYGLTPTYQMGADFLADCATIEDWGCGKGWFRRMVPEGRYRGVDGSQTPFADEVVDLAVYRSRVEGIFIRHVLEHDYRWREILANAMTSFTRKLMLVIFTPMGAETKEIAFAPDPGVPDISFAESDLVAFFDGPDLRWRVDDLNSATQYGVETVYYVERT